MAAEESLIIRRATPADAPTLAAHNAALAAETEGLALDSGRLLSGVQAVLEDAAKGIYFVAEAAGAVVGQLMITFEWSDWRNGTFWWLQSVYVQPSHRRQGVFRRLYAEVLRQAEAARTVCGARLYVAPHNTAAQEVYRRLGMRRAPYEMYELDFVLRR